MEQVIKEPIRYKFTLENGEVVYVAHYGYRGKFYDLMLPDGSRKDVKVKEVKWIDPENELQEEAKNEVKPEAPKSGFLFNNLKEMREAIADAKKAEGFRVKAFGEGWQNRKIFAIVEGQEDSYEKTKDFLGKSLSKRDINNTVNTAKSEYPNMPFTVFIQYDWYEVFDGELMPTQYSLDIPLYKFIPEGETN